MQRREAFKKMGLLGLVGLSGMALVSCGNEEKPKSERDKLLTNRERKTFADPANPTKAELKHTPDIRLGENDTKGMTLVEITVGMDGIIHPSSKEHWIDFIKVYVNERLMADTEFVNGGIRGYGHYYMTLEKGDVVRVEAACNKHGIWENSLTVS